MGKGAKLAIKIPCITVGVILVLFIIASFIAGPIAKNYINNNSKELCGRTVTIEKISTNLFVGKVKIIDFVMLEANDKDKFCSFDTLIVKINPFKLLANEVKLNQITLISPVATITQDGDVFNFTSLVDFFANDEPETEESSSWDINLNDISLKNGKILYQDLAIGSKFGMDNLKLEIPHIFFSNESTDVGVNLDFAEGGKLGLQVAYGLENGLYDLKVSLQDFSLSPLLPYLKSNMQVAKFDGKLNTEIAVKGSTEHLMNIVANGVLDISDVVMVDTHDHNIVTANNIVVDIDKIDLEKNLFNFNKIAVNDLATEYIIYDSLRNNFTDLFVETQSEVESTENETSTNSTDMNLFVKDLQLNNANILYSDLSLLEKFEIPVTNININANNVNLTSKFTAKIKAMVGDKGELKGSFAGSLADFSNLKLNLSLRNIKMKDLSPYCVHYTAYPITDGLLSLTSYNNIVNNELTSRNEVNILNCTVEKKLKDIDAEYSNIPLKAGLYILSDRNKKISIDLPVSGNISDPTFKVGKIIWRTFCNLIVKIAASPFDALKKDKTNDAFRDMPMNVNDYALSVENYQQLNKLVAELQEILVEKPDLKLSIQQSLNKKANFDQIALFKLKTDYYIEANNLSSTPLTINDYKNIQEIKDKDGLLVDYAKQKAGSRNTLEAAKKLYSEEQIEMIYKMSLQRREQNLRDFFAEQGVDLSVISILEPEEESTDKQKVTIRFGVEVPEIFDDFESEIDE